MNGTDDSSGSSVCNQHLEYPQEVQCLDHKASKLKCYSMSSESQTLIPLLWWSQHTYACTYRC